MKPLPTCNPLTTLAAGSLYLASAATAVGAAEQKTYSRPPFAPFSSQMPDALLGNDKYEKPVWNLHDSLGLPKWLAIGLEQRTRYETLDNAFKANGKGSDQQIALQSDLWLQASFNAFRLGAEFLDARALAADGGSGINNTLADQADFLQGYLAWARQNMFYSGLGFEMVAGRQTLNLGSRRLIARNAMRNTINSFTGIKLRLLDYDTWQFTGFVTMPVNRYPTAAIDLLAETHEFDEEDSHTWFSGGFFELYNLAWHTSAEVYLYHLDEGDSIRNQTRNRRYFTPGARWFIKPAKSQFDFQLETIGQFGTVRASSGSRDGLDQNHSAWYQHADIGYSFDTAWSPHLTLEYDYASGDDNPHDNKDQRFDTLYGARRFEFGATGIYGAFARTNINSPGARITFSPRSDLQASVSHRLFWLASPTDSWAGTGLQDKTGRSGDSVGQQLELTARWDLNSSLNFETGWTHLFKGEFARIAPSAPRTPDTDYFYVQSLLRF